MKLIDLQHFPLIYLATPFTKYPTGIEYAFQDACSLAGALMRCGLSVYSPIAESYPISLHSGLDPLDGDMWLKRCAPFMKKCDALLVATMESWDTSAGIKHEIEAFKRAGKPNWLIDPNSLEVY